ncbi:MAG: hypothetical protein ACTHMX_00355 [Thermomicrobiales bacterium]
MLESPTRRRGLLSLVAMLAIFGVALHGPIAAAAAAQDDPASDTFDFNDLDGFQRGAGRTYMGDLSALFGNLDAYATPGAEIATPDLSELGIFMLGGFVAEFDNGDHASSGLDKLADQITQSGDEDEDFTFSETKIDNIGDKTKAYAGTYSDEGIDGSAVVILTQKGNFLYAAVAISFGSDPTDAAKSFVTDMTNNKPGAGVGTFNEDGTSTGGLWDVFPSSDAEYLKGLTPAADEDLSQSGE